MKKTVICATLAILSGCATQKNNQQEIIMQQEVVCEHVEPCVQNIQLITNCEAEKPEVLRPRVTDEISDAKIRRCCPNDVPSDNKIQTVIPNLPEIYSISANRTANKMLKDITPAFADLDVVKVYVSEEAETQQDLPDGFSEGIKTLKYRLSNASNILLVEDKQQADYILNNKIKWYDTPYKNVPSIKYDIILLDKDNKTIGEWSEIMYQAEGDKSWW